MEKVLYIKANPKSSKLSKTFKVSDSFIESYRGFHPNDEIITLDLYDEEIKFIDDNLIMYLSNKGELSPDGDGGGSPSYFVSVRKSTINPVNMKIYI